MSLALSTCVLFISFMQLVNRALFLNITFLLGLFVATDVSPVFGTVIVSITSIYSPLLYHKLDFSVKFLNLI